MEKRVLIAVILSIAVLYGYSFLAPQPPKKPDAQKEAPRIEQAAPAPASASTAPVAVSPVPATSGVEKDVTAETDLFSAVFSTRGGSLKKLVLKKYHDVAGAAGKPVTLVDAKNPDSYTLNTAGVGFDIPAGSIFSISTGNVTATGTETRDIEFHLATPQGLVLKKTYTIRGDSYSISLKEQVANTGSAPLKGSIQNTIINTLRADAEKTSFEVYGPSTYVDGKLVTEKVKDLSKAEKNYKGRVAWTGFGDQYFFTALVSPAGNVGDVQVRRTPANQVENIVTAPAITLNPGQSSEVEYRAYLGPKDLDILKSQGNSMEEVIDLGWFSALAKPLLHALKFFYRYTGNYGIAIIIITVILKILFFPLTHKSYKSMKEMQKIQPKMTELREKFKDDRDGLNKAVMELYKTHKVNPLGGCLPMLVQIPVFFALYKALMYSIELRHAPFMLWITDLSTKDPYYVTPIIMGATMFVQQKMTPSNMDPVQAKMMLALPIVFTFMFLNFPSGLVLYWLVNNILTIAQQAYINKSLATGEH